MDTNNSQPCQPFRLKRANSSGIALTADDARLVKGMLLRGDAQHFGVNPGRIAEIATGERFTDVATALQDELPDPGPYLTPCQASDVADALTVARAALDRMERLISRIRG